VCTSGPFANAPVAINSIDLRALEERMRGCVRKEIEHLQFLQGHPNILSSSIAFATLATARTVSTS
jgi:hypothetical protein